MPFSAPYKRGSGSKTDSGDVPTRFERYGVLEIKRRLSGLNYLVNADLDKGRFGWNMHWAIKRFQRDYALVADGIMGESTLGMLFGPLVDEREEAHKLPYRLLHAIIMKESRYDPGAYYVNDSGSVDRGIAMLNSSAYPDLPDAEAVKVGPALGLAAVRLRAAYDTFRYKGPELRLECTIASYNSPVGARLLFDGREITPKLRDYVADVKSLMVT